MYVPRKILKWGKLTWDIGIRLKTERQCLPQYLQVHKITLICDYNNLNQVSTLVIINITAYKSNQSNNLNKLGTSRKYNVFIILPYLSPFQHPACTFKRLISKGCDYRRKWPLTYCKNPTLPNLELIYLKFKRSSIGGVNNSNVACSKFNHAK